MSTTEPLPGPVEQPGWLTVVEDRRPRTKTHRTLGQAKAAIGVELRRGARGGQLFEWTGTGWSLLHDVAPGTQPQDMPWRTAALAGQERRAAWQRRRREEQVNTLAGLIAANANLGARQLAEVLHDAGVRPNGID